MGRALLVAICVCTWGMRLVHSSDYPFITSVEVSPAQIIDGGQVTVTLRGTSTTPISFASYSVPRLNYGGGGSIGLWEPDSSDVWTGTLTITISEWDESGTYTVQGISVGNQANLWSDPHDTSFEVQNSQVAQTPVITSVSLSSYSIVDSGTVTLTIQARSNAFSEYAWRLSSLDGPAGSIYGGGGTSRFTSLGDDLWETQVTYEVILCSPTGTYTFSNLRVGPFSTLLSPPAGPVSFTFSSSIGEVPAPVLQSITPNPAVVQEGGSTVFEYMVRDPYCEPKFVSSSFYGPDRDFSVWGGGGSMHFTSVDADTWSMDYPVNFNQYMPSGTYTLSGAYVTSSSQKDSNTFQDVQVFLNNSFEAKVPVILNQTLHIDYETEVFQVTLLVDSNAPVYFFSVLVEDLSNDRHLQIVEEQGDLGQVTELPDGNFIFATAYSFTTSEPAPVDDSLLDAMMNSTGADASNKAMRKSGSSTCFHARASNLQLGNAGYKTSEIASEMELVCPRAGGGLSSILIGGVVAGAALVLLVAGVLWRKRRGPWRTSGKGQEARSKV